MTHLKQQISLIPFSIEHWYSPYKRRRFENRSDQTFCILLIKDVLSVIESVNLCRRQNWKRKWSRFKFNFFWLIWIRMSLEYPFHNCEYIHRRHSFRQVWLKSVISVLKQSCWLLENWDNREVLTNVREWPIPQWRRKWKTRIHAQIRITTKSQPRLQGHLLPVPAKIGRSLFPCLSVILFTEWQNE